MRDPKRIPRIIAKIKQLWELTPDLRFGQLVSYIVNWEEAKEQKDLFYIEDEDFAAKLEKVLLMEKRKSL